MMLSLLLDKSMAAAGTVFALILCDLFGSIQAAEWTISIK